VPQADSRYLKNWQSYVFSFIVKMLTFERLNYKFNYKL